MKKLITSFGLCFAFSLLSISAHADTTKPVELQRVVVVGKRLPAQTAVKNITLPRVVITAKSNAVKPATPGLVQVKAVSAEQEKS